MFDFDSDHAIDMDEITIMVVCFLEGWGKIIDKDMPPRNYLEKAAEILYSAAEFIPDGRINVKGVSDWVEQNENLMGMYLMFEPADKIDERYTVLPLPRCPAHLNMLSEKYLGKKIRRDENITSPSSFQKKVFCFEM